MSAISALASYWSRSSWRVSNSSSLVSRSRLRCAGETAEKSASSRRSAQVRGCARAASISGAASRVLKVTPERKAECVCSASLIRAAAVAAPAMIPKSHNRSQISRAEGSLTSVERPSGSTNKTRPLMVSLLCRRYAGGVLENLRYQRRLGESGGPEGRPRPRHPTRLTQKRTPAGYSHPRTPRARGAELRRALR
jgi:hypothetical protein